MSQARDQTRFYNLGSGSWLAWANDTAAHYAVIHCPRQRTIGPAVAASWHTTAPISHTTPSRPLGDVCFWSFLYQVVQLHMPYYIEGGRIKYTFCSNDWENMNWMGISKIRLTVFRVFSTHCQTHIITCNEYRQRRWHITSISIYCGWLYRTKFLPAVFMEGRTEPTDIAP